MSRLLLVLLGLTLTVLGLFVEVPWPFVAPPGAVPEGARVAFHLGEWAAGTAPWTLQALGPWFAGLALPPVQAGTSMVLWLVACLAGAPWAESSRGPAMLAGPAFGFQAGMVVQAVVIAALARGGRPSGRFMALLAGQAVCWAIGAAWLAARGQEPMPVLAAQLAGSPGWFIAWAVVAWLPTLIGRRPKPQPRQDAPQVIR
ncbi:MAG: biotin transporter BioY [Candidatus Sericytochromatia bacterium]|nr:biotin transporter BioY [Candidatus Sericytochromatia bacterium]